MSELFLLFQRTWGHRWDDVIGDYVDATLLVWSQGLAGMSLQDLARRFAWCRDHLAWPPSIQEFREAGLARRPKERAQWLAWGEARGIEPRPGEDWEPYLGRVQRAWEAQHGGV